jgi:hypothetical protein
VHREGKKFEKLFDFPFAGVIGDSRSTHVSEQTCLSPVAKRVPHSGHNYDNNSDSFRKYVHKSKPPSLAASVFPMLVFAPVEVFVHAVADPIGVTHKFPQPIGDVDEDEQD